MAVLFGIYFNVIAEFLENMCHWRKLLAWLFFILIEGRKIPEDETEQHLPSCLLPQSTLEWKAYLQLLGPSSLHFTCERGGEMKGGPWGNHNEEPSSSGRWGSEQRGGIRETISLPGPATNMVTDHRPWGALGEKCSLQNPDAKVRNRVLPAASWLFS